MNYKEAVRYLDSFINYEKMGFKDRRHFKLERMRRLLDIFGNPQDNFMSIHITGTKGKGSVASYTASILKEAAFRVGLYTSPHLVSTRERIKFDSEMISETDFACHLLEIKKALEKVKLDPSPTYFEIITILAFNYFRTRNIDFGVIEVGLGGRLDATNIIKPLVIAISPISYDHTEILGSTLEEIAREKSDIIKPGSVCISAPQEREVLEVIKRKCRVLGVNLILVGRDITFKEIYHDSEKEIFDVHGMLKTYQGCKSYLIGRHQILNACSAVGIAESLVKKDINISSENIKKGLENTENPGRCEIISKNPYVVLDGAQNKASAKALKEAIKRNFNYKKLILILGISKKKDIKGICEELTPLANTVILTKANIQRAEEPHLIQRHISGKKTMLMDSVEAAMEKARTLAAWDDMILVTGSFFVIGEVKKETDKVRDVVI